MSNEITDLVFILDKSNSMSGMERATIGGYNSLLEKQKEDDGRCRVTTVLFNDKYKLLHNRVDIHDVGKLTGRDYRADGNTALMDAIGRTINKVARFQTSADLEKRPEKAMFVIVTDGMENASRKFSSAQIKSMIERQKEENGWEFVFLGANIDAVKTAALYGIDSSRAADYRADSRGTRLNFTVMNKAVRVFRKVGKLNSSFLKDIRSDGFRRGGKLGRKIF
ncbi:MAG: VWA domain-containing protein [Deltaproteobacteria bacterium]|jgi:Mg-chelatase subunit ChlD|nr:VWA domain-containing protein [Deltaproteobacteria bacterium]